MRILYSLFILRITNVSLDNVQELMADSQA